MLNWLKENTADARAKLGAEIGKFRNKAFMEATVSGCAIMAAVDGDISSEEKKKMIGFMERSEELKHFDLPEVITLFKKIVEEFEFDADIGKANALKTIAKVRSKPDQARVLVRVVCALAASDGNFDDDEKKVGREIALELGLDPADFDL